MLSGELTLQIFVRVLDMQKRLSLMRALAARGGPGARASGAAGRGGAAARGRRGQEVMSVDDTSSDSDPAELSSPRKQRRRVETGAAARGASGHGPGLAAAVAEQQAPAAANAQGDAVANNPPAPPQRSRPRRRQQLRPHVRRCLTLSIPAPRLPSLPGASLVAPCSTVLLFRMIEQDKQGLARCPSSSVSFCNRRRRSDTRWSGAFPVLLTFNDPWPPPAYKLHSRRPCTPTQEHLGTSGRVFQKLPKIIGNPRGDSVSPGDSVAHARQRGLQGLAGAAQGAVPVEVGRHTSGASCVRSSRLMPPAMRCD